MELELEGAFRMEVADRIRWFRKARNFTQEQLGLAIGAGTAQSAKAMVAKIERGQVPGGLRLRKLTEVLGCSADILLSGKSRELMEVIRLHVPLPEVADNYQMSAFKVARIFLFCAITVDQTDSDSEFVEAANRLLYMAEHDPIGCHNLFTSMPTGLSADHRADNLSARHDLRGLVRHAMQGQSDGSDPAAYRGYRRAPDAIALVLEHYIAPEQPALSQLVLGAHTDSRQREPSLPVLSNGSAGPLPGRQRMLNSGTALVEIENNELEPLAREGQFAIVASDDRTPKLGDLIACWTPNGVRFGRLTESDRKATHLMALSPSVFGTVDIPAAEVTAIRVVTGIWFE